VDEEPSKWSARLTAAPIPAPAWCRDDRRSRKMGFDVVMGHEFEFYFLTKAHSRCSTAAHLNSCATSRAVMRSRQLQIGIDIITHNCEYAASQLEINYGPGKNLAGADSSPSERLR
jgi:glutamine synthetase